MIDAFHRRLHQRITEHIETRQAILLQGVAGNSLEEIGLRYARDASYMLALKDVLAMSDMIEQEIYGDQARKELEG